MKKQIGTAAACMTMTLGLACSVASAQDFGKLGGMLSGGSMSSGSMSNVAGLLKYCVQNNYLGGNSGAAGIQDKLMGKLRSSPKANNGQADSSHASGLLGQLTGHSDATDKPSASTANPASDPGYLAGAEGLLKSGNGKTTDLSSLGGSSSGLKAKLTEKVCSTVLKQGESFIGM